MKKYKFYPDSNRVLVNQFKVMEKTAGDFDFQLHSNADELGMHQAAHTFGEIVAMGPMAFTKDRWGNKKDCEYKIGDHVYFKQYPGPLHRSETDDLGRPQGDLLYTINDIDILGHVEIEES